MNNLTKIDLAEDILNVVSCNKKIDSVKIEEILSEHISESLMARIKKELEFNLTERENEIIESINEEWYKTF